jgi:hypothetical protein
MNASSMNDLEPVLDRARVREVTGVFRSREALDAATGQLLVSGFDRLDIDVLNSVAALRERVGGAYYVAPEELADVPSAPRWPFIGWDDVTVLNVTVSAIVGAATAMGTAYWVLASGGSASHAVVSAALLGIIAGGIGFSLAAFAFRRKRQEYEELLASRGLILWVRVRSPEQEDRAQDIMRAYGGRAVRVHEVDIEKRTSDLPLGNLRPDPWLGPERLGQP